MAGQNRAWIRASAAPRGRSAADTRSTTPAALRPNETSGGANSSRPKRDPAAWSVGTLGKRRHGHSGRPQRGAEFPPMDIKYTGLRLGMRTLGRLSDGIRLGWETGFDSGRTLDYVYRNKASGITP
ncbi:MAG: hypothetical protein E6H94_10350, partial [Chloroflexi bacterium]